MPASFAPSLAELEACESVDRAGCSEVGGRFLAVMGIYGAPDYGVDGDPEAAALRASAVGLVRDFGVLEACDARCYASFLVGAREVWARYEAVGGTSAG
jgi:hypothetical protein